MNIVLTHIVGMVLGGTFGYFVLYKLIGCRTGTCPLTAKPHNAILYGVLLGLIFAGGFSVQEGQDSESIATRSKYQKISSQKAKERMDSGAPIIIVDVRRQDEFDSGHIPGAILIPNETIGEERPQALPDLDAEILIYCRSGNRSAQAAKKLIELGYTNVYDFGGILDWPYEIE